MKPKNYFKKAALLFMVCSIQFIMAQVPNYVPTNGLVGYWPFNGNTNDVSGGGRNGIIHSVNSTVNYPTGVNGSCIHLTGSGHTGTNGDYVTIPPIGFNTLPSYTVSLWVKHDGNASPLNHDENYICGHSSSNSCQGTFGIGCNTGFPNTNVGYSNHYVGGQDNSAFAGTWVLRTLVINNGSISIYRNGILLSTQSGTTATDQESEIGLGTHWFCSGGTQSTRFIGEMDELGIWNRALSQQEITSLYTGLPFYSDTCNAVSGSLVNGLVAYYPFCGNAYDQSGHGNNGNVNGASLTTDRFGNTNAAYSFDGTSNYIEVPHSSSLNFGTQDFTISAWAKPSQFQSNDQHIVSKERSLAPDNNQFRMAIAKSTNPSDKHYYFATATSTGTGLNWTSASGYVLQSNSIAPITTWNHITIVRTGITYKLYINGILNSSDNTTNGLVQDYSLNLQNLIFGAQNQATGTGKQGFFNGIIDDIGFWNRALTTQEVTQLYNQNQCFTNTTVTDTLVINVGQFSFTNPVTYANNITIYPNPASTQVNIGFNNISDLNGGTIKIINSLGQQVATTPITTSGTNTTMTLSTWGGSGLYFVQIVNPQGQIVDIKKILLQ